MLDFPSSGDGEFAVFVWVSYLSPNTRRSPRCINTQTGDGRANCLQCPFPGQVREIRKLCFFLGGFQWKLLRCAVGTQHGLRYTTLKDKFEIYFRFVRD